MPENVYVVIKVRPMCGLRELGGCTSRRYAFANAAAATEALRKRGWTKRMFHQGWDDQFSWRSAEIKFTSHSLHLRQAACLPEA